MYQSQTKRLSNIDRANRTLSARLYYQASESSLSGGDESLSVDTSFGHATGEPSARSLALDLTGTTITILFIL